MNQERGDALRLRLAQLVRHFRNQLTEAGFFATGGLFPVQTLAPIPKLDTSTLHYGLLRLGVRAVLHCGHNGYGPRISFLITAQHTMRDIDHVVDVLAREVRAKIQKQQYRG